MPKTIIDSPEVQRAIGSTSAKIGDGRLDRPAFSITGTIQVKD
jgi:hypothetical protein